MVNKIKTALISVTVLFLLNGCISTIKPAKQIDDNQKLIAKEEQKVDNTY